MKQVRVLEAGLSLEDRVEPHHIGDIVSLTDEQYARLPQDAFGVAVADVSPGGSSQPWPRAVAQIRLDATTRLPVHVKVINADGSTATDVSIADYVDDLDWLRVTAAGIWYASDKHYEFMVNIQTGSSQIKFSAGANEGWGATTAIVPASVTNFRLCGVIAGCPSAWEDGGPSGEPGWDQFWSESVGADPANLIMNIYVSS